MYEGGMILTPRDNDLIAYVAASREVGVDLLARIFFERDPQTGKQNGNPRAAAARRLAMLRDAGFLIVFGKRTAVTSKGAVHVDGAVSAPCPMSMRAHHDGTLAAIEHFRRYHELGATVCDVVLEHRLRQQRMKGCGVARRKIGALPDAVITLRTPTGNRSVALEYVSSKYTQAMIEGKLIGLRGDYDDIVFYADTPATAARVMRATGMVCTCS